MPDVVSLRYEDACQKHQRLQRVEAENAALRAEKRVLEQRLLGVKHVLQPCDVLSLCQGDAELFEAKEWLMSEFIRHCALQKELERERKISSGAGGPL
ncbi:unnamed protein product [Symbiodinium natans]|uniref:Uncharacterized protein n=1 Tax=Symbiodinium natans TaxID=878477 RepID=A0A812TGE6_9DINO|nr:unnamed protein product [Symbiodinium natans]